MDEENPFVLETASEVLSEKSLGVGDCLRALTIINGRFRMRPNGMSSVSSAYRTLFSSLAEQPFSCLSVDQWATLVDCLCSGSIIPSTFHRLSEEDEDRLQESNPAELLSPDATDRRKNLLRRIRTYLSEYKITHNIVYTCIGDYEGGDYLRVLSEDDSVPSPSLEVLSSLRVVLALFSQDGHDCLLSPSLVRDVVIASLAYLKSNVGADSPDNTEIFTNSAAIHEMTIKCYFSLCEFRETSDSFLQTIAQAYLDILRSEGAMNNNSQFLTVLDLFIEALPWFPSREEPPLCDEETMWDCVGRLAEIVDQEMKGANGSESWSMDSPNEKMDDSDNWLDSILCSVPLDMDRQAADEQSRATRVNKLRHRICYLLQNVSVRSSTVPSQKIIGILHKLCELSSTSLGACADLGKSFQIALRNGAISEEIQESLVKECLTLGHMQSEWVVKNFVCVASPKLRNTLAETIIRYFIDQIKTKQLDGEKLSFSGQDLLLCRRARCVMTEDGSPMFKEVLTYFNRICSQKRMSEDPLVDQVMSMMHIMFAAGCFLENIADTSAAESYAENVKAITPLSATGCSSSELSAACRHFATWSLSQSNFLCLPYVFPIFTEKELNESKDFVVLSFLFRLIPFYRSSHGGQLFKALYTDEAFLDKVDEYFAPSNTEKLFTRMLSIFSDRIHSRIGKSSTVDAHYILAFYDCLLVAISCDMCLSVTTMELFRNMLSNLDLYELSSTTAIRWGYMFGLERLSSLFKIYRNSMLNECMSFQRMVDDCVDTEILEIMHHDKKKIISPAYPANSYKLASDKLDFIINGDENMVESVIECIRSEIASYVFTRDKNMSCALRDEIAKFYIEVSSSAQYSIMDAETANNFLNLMIPDNSALHHVYLLNTILAVAMNTDPQDTFEKYPLNLFFGDVLAELLSSEIYAKRWTKNPPMDPLEEYLEKCSDESDFSFALTPNLVSALSSIFCNSKTDPSIKSGIAQTVLANIHSLPVWMKRSQFPTVVLSGFAGIFRYLEGNSDAIDKIKRAVSGCVDLVIRDYIVQELSEFMQIEVQSTDRFAQACLSSRPAKQPKALKLMRSVVRRTSVTDIFSETLKMICMYSDKETHCKIVAAAAAVLGQWCGLSSEEEKVVRGETMLQSTAENQLLFRTSVANGLLKYCVELYTHLGAQAEAKDGYFSDSEDVRDVINRKGGATALPAVMRKNDGGHKSSGKLCTFATTETHFAQQHWYHCYSPSCKMTENVGMCSVCAVNCHRGHDVVYCKFGSFFCDCGAKKCESMKATSHSPSANSAARGRRIVVDNSQKCEDPSEPPFFTFPGDIGESSEELIKQLEIIKKGMEKNVSSVDKAVRGLQDAHLNMWNMENKREMVLQSLSAAESIRVLGDQPIMDIIESEGKGLGSVATPRRPRDQQHIERMKPRDICGIIKLGSYRQLWLMLDGLTLTIHHISHGDNIVEELTTARQDIETIPFAARRLSCCENKAVILGRTEVLLLRFCRDGEITERTSVHLCEITTHTNPIIKAVWAPKRPATVAIATIQYVRIYDITMDTSQHLEDLVLPVGNVQDVFIVEDGENLCVLVLSSAGHLYRHVVTTTVPQSTHSYFLTNTIDSPSQQAGPPISFHYSPVSHLFFISYENASWFTVVKDGNFIADPLRLEWRKLSCEHALNCWHESSGIVAAMNHTGGPVVTYFYPTNKQLIMQRVDHNKRTPYAHLLYTSPSNTTVHGLLFYYDSPYIVPLTAHWSSLPDLWIEGLPLQFTIRTDNIKDECSEDLPMEDLVTMLECCEVIQRVEVTSDEVQRFYDSQDMTQRLSHLGGLPLTIMQCSNFTLKYSLPDQSCIARAIRIEVPANKGPSKVEIGLRTVKLATTVNRFFDVLLTRTESLRLEMGELSLKFISRDNYTVITSIRVYGIRRRDFGFPSPQVTSKSPLSLPDTHTVNLLEMFRVLAQHGLFVSNKDWLVKVAQQLSSFRRSHKEVSASANRLLRVLFPNDLIAYYQAKDDIFFEDLMSLIASNTTLPHAMIPTLTQQMKLLLCTRATPFLKKLIAVPEAPLKLISYLYDQVVLQIPEESISLVELFCSVTFLLLSQLEDNDAIANLFLNIFAVPKSANTAHYVRLVSQSLIYSFSLTTRNDRQRLSNLSTGILKSGGIRPYFNKSKILEEDDDVAFVVHMLGPQISPDLLRDTDLFDLEAKFLVDLLKKVLIKLRDEGTIGILTPVSRSDTVPTLSLLIFAIVLLAQLYPERVLPTLTELIGMIDWKNPHVEKTEDCFRKFLLVRLVFVFLSKCGDHAEHKKKESSEKKAARAKSREGSEEQSQQPGDSRGSSVADVEVVGLEETPAGEPKKRHIEKILEEIVSRLETAEVLPFCLKVLQSVVSHWKRPLADAPSSKKAWSRETSTATVADINAIKMDGRQCDADDYFHSMVTDVALRLPLQMKKLNKKLEFSKEWTDVLCDMVLLPHAQQVRHQARKLLICLCGFNKAQFKTVRDQYMMMNRLKVLREKFDVFDEGINHQELTEIVDIVSSLTTTANERPSMWRVICEEQLTWMLEMTYRISDPVSTNVLELLVAAIRDETSTGGTEMHIADKLVAVEENRVLLKKLLMRYLVGRDEDRRWLAHGFLRSTIQLASRANQLVLIRIMWFEIWPLARGSGANGAQLADLLATYLPRVLSSQELMTVCENEISAIQETADRIVAEGHDRTYDMMIGLGLGWTFMLMVSNPCLNCFSKKKVTETYKLSAIKQDTRFSSNAMLVKLAGFYEVSKVVIKLSEVKRSKTVKKVSVFYCSKVVDSPVDLKTKPELWQMAGSTTTATGDGEMTVSLSVPVITASLIVQFSELTESRQNNELHCPRCSSIVQPNPGVCENCGENAFQCFKCRSINYDDKDPFLCQNCGFCKYARIDVNVVCRPLPRVQPITNDTDRAAAIDHMSQLLVDVEQFRSQMYIGRAMCESLWLRCRPLPTQEIRSEGAHAAEITVAGMPNIPTNEHPIYCVKEIIKYCSVAHEELCSHTQQLLAYREELRQFDRTVASDVANISNGFYNTSGSCFGCLCAAIRHSVAILQGICDDTACASKILSNVDGYRTLARLGQRYLPLHGDLEAFVCRLAFENEQGAEKLCELVEEGILPGTTLCRSILNHQDSLWQMKLRALLKIAIKRPDEDTTVNTLLLIGQLLTDGRRVRKRAFLKMHDSDGGPGDDLPAQRKVRVVNRKVENSAVLANWMSTENKWTECEANGGNEDVLTEIDDWLWQCLFSQWSVVRSAAVKVLLSLSKHPGYLGSVVRIVLRGMSMASEKSPQVAEQFFGAVNTILAKRKQLRMQFYLYGLHMWLLNYIHAECKRLYDEEQNGGSIDHNNGILLRNYIEVLVSLLCGGPAEGILLKASVEGMLLPLLQNTIYLKRLLLHRTRSIDICRQALELLLRKVSSKEPLLLMHATVRTLDQTDLDQYTQAQVISVIMEVLAPERHKDDGFLIQIEKDPAQEDFLQGRMTGNPYKSSDPGMGPLMRDLKNKICRDTEMIALLEDDTGMELLVNNQIISLSLPVAAVYDKLWHRDHPGQPLTIVYRMRGLMGDAVEPFVSTLGDTEESSAEDSALSSLVENFESYGGIKKILDIVATCDVSTSGRILLSHSLALLNRCAKSEKGRVALVKAGVVCVFATILRRCVESEDEGVMLIGADFLKLLGSLVTDVNTHDHLHHLTAEDARWLTELALKKNGAGICSQLSSDVAHLLGSLVLGDDEAEEVLVSCCRDTFRWCTIDTTTDVARRTEIIQGAETLCEVVSGILPSASGHRLKNKIVSSGVVHEACTYLLNSHPPLYSATESQEWKTFLMRPSLRLMLTFMHSMAQGHLGSQNALSEQSLPVLHRLEQVASDNSIGTLAENVMEALKENEEVAKKIEAVRLETKQKKRQLAMAMRNKQLSKMGMQVGKQGEVKIAARKIANEPHLEEVADPLAVCCICREPVLRGDRPCAAYAFASIYTIAEAPLLSSVSQMVLVHIDCHMTAIRRSGGGRNTDEWTKAALHNAGARCNVLTPMVTSDPSEVPFQQALARYQTDLDVITSTPAVTRSLVFTDMCQLIDRFINYQSFSDKSQGGGRESNAQYLAVLHLLACALPAGDLPSLLPQWRIYSFLMTEQSLASWNEQRIDVLRAALDDGVSNGRSSWADLRGTCLAWAFVDGYFRRVVPVEEAERVAWLRQNLLSTLTKTTAFVQSFDAIAATADFPSFAAAADVPADDFNDIFA